jgi:hypothetical protein
MVPEDELEPSLLSKSDFESVVPTNFTSSSFPCSRFYLYHELIHGGQNMPELGGLVSNKWVSVTSGLE